MADLVTCTIRSNVCKPRPVVHLSRVTTNVVTASAAAAREGTEKERKIDWKVLQTKFVVILEQTWW